MRVGFLFNHYAAHQVPHAAPFAFELSRLRPDLDVVIAYSTQDEGAMAKAIARLYPGHRCVFQELTWKRKRWGKNARLQQEMKRKRRILKNNLDFFRTLDVLVTPERNSLRLRREEYGLSHLKFINTRHGAGDRAGSFDERSAIFDFTLLPGQKYVDDLERRGFLGSYAKVGWPKFEVMQRLKPKRKRLFWNRKPTVVYAPHFNETVSSWHSMGEAVLRFFADQLDFNLIVAPHVVLFSPWAQHEATMPKGYRWKRNMLIDTGSARSADMTYMRAADIYLGDVSSQVYEFLIEPRPCLFLNAHGVDWEHDPHYRHFALGQVVDNVAEGLGPALEQAIVTHERYRRLQEEAIAYTFHREEGSTAAERGAHALSEFLQSIACDGEPASEGLAAEADPLSAAS